MREGGEAAVERALAWLAERAPAALEPGLEPGRPHAAFNITVLGHAARHAARAGPVRPCPAARGGVRAYVPDRPGDVPHHRQRRRCGGSPASGSAASARCRPTIPTSARTRKRSSASGASAPASPSSAAPISAMIRRTRWSRSASLSLERRLSTENAANWGKIGPDFSLLNAIAKRCGFALYPAAQVSQGGKNGTRKAERFAESGEARRRSSPRSPVRIRCRAARSSARSGTTSARTICRTRRTSARSSPTTSCGRSSARTAARCSR